MKNSFVIPTSTRGTRVDRRDLAFWHELLGSIGAVILETVHHEHTYQGTNRLRSHAA